MILYEARGVSCVYDRERKIEFIERRNMLEIDIPRMLQDRELIHLKVSWRPGSESSTGREKNWSVVRCRVTEHVSHWNSTLRRNENILKRQPLADISSYFLVLVSEQIPGTQSPVALKS